MAVVVVGAGIAGIACAVELSAAGVPVRVLERARALGGRMASADLEGRPVDYGAAYFTVRDPEFAAVVEGWRTAGLARQWTSELTVFGAEGRRSKSGPVRWAAPHGLRSLVVDLARDLDITLNYEVHQVGPASTGARPASSCSPCPTLKPRGYSIPARRPVPQWPGVRGDR